jgi:uncharacterized membrane protein YheB (UPF0754 family)
MKEMAMDNPEDLLKKQEDRINALVEETETRLENLTLTAEKQLQNILTDFIKGDLGNIQKELRSTVQSLDRNFQSRNSSRLSNALLNEIGDFDSSNSISSFFSLSGSVTNASKNQQANELQRLLQRAIRNL